VTSEEITEMMAFERIEPFGSLHDEFMHGQVWAVVANTHRDTAKRPQPYAPSDGMPALGRALGKGDDKPILLDDKDAQSKLIASLIRTSRDE
jgi:hypothetical protein